MHRSEKCNHLIHDGIRMCPFCGTMLVEGVAKKHGKEIEKNGADMGKRLSQQQEESDSANASEVSSVDEKTLLQSRIKESTSIIKHIFESYCPIYNVQLIFQVHLYNKIIGRDVFLCITRHEPMIKKLHPYYEIYIDEKDGVHNFKFFEDFIISHGLDFAKKKDSAYDVESNIKATEEYSGRINSIYLAALINGGGNDVMLEEAREIESEIRQKSYKDYYVYYKRFEELSEVLGNLSELLQMITEKSENCSNFDLELHIASIKGYLGFSKKNDKNAVFRSFCSFYGDAKNQLLFNDSGITVFKSEDVDACLAELKNQQEQVREKENRRKEIETAKRKEREEKKLKMMQEAERRKKRKVVFGFVCMVVLIVLFFVADYYVIVDSWGFSGPFAYVPAWIASLVGCQLIKDRFGHY